MNEREVKYKISLQDMLTNGLKKAEEGATSLDRRMLRVQETTMNLAKAAAGLMVFKQIVGVMGDLVNEFDTAAVANAQLNATIKSTGGIAGLTADQLNKQAEALALVSRYDDDAITGMQSLLLTFTNIRGEMVTNATPAILDMAAKMGTDLQGNAILVGKALNDPIKGISALTRVGVTFSQEQKNMIEQLVKTGQAAEAQKIILAELNTEFGGSAKAAAEAGSGPLIVLQNQFNNVKESLGGLIADGLKAIMPYIQMFVGWLESAVGWMKEHPGLMKAIGIGLAVVAGAFALVTIATWAWNAAMYANPIVWIIIAIGALVAAIIVAYNKFSWFKKIVDAIGSAFRGLWEIIKAGWNILVKIAEALYDIADALGLVDAMSKFFEGLGVAWGWLYDNVLAPIGDWFADMEHKMKVMIRFTEAIMSGMNWKDAYTLSEQSVTAEETMEALRDQQNDASTEGSLEGNMPAMNGDMPTVPGALGKADPSNVGSKAPTNIYINIQKLIEGGINISTTNMKEGTAEATDIVLAGLLGVVNDANRIPG